MIEPELMMLKNIPKIDIGVDINPDYWIDYEVKHQLNYYFRIKASFDEKVKRNHFQCVNYNDNQICTMPESKKERSEIVDEIFSCNDGRERYVSLYLYYDYSNIGDVEFMVDYNEEMKIMSAFIDKCIEGTKLRKYMVIQHSEQLNKSGGLCIPHFHINLDFPERPKNRMGEICKLIRNIYKYWDGVTPIKIGMMKTE